MNIKRGFIQIPVLVAFMILGIIVTATGDYYEAKHKDGSNDGSIKTSLPNTALDFTALDLTKREPETVKQKSDTNRSKPDSYKESNQANTNKTNQLVSELTAAKEANDDLHEALREIEEKIISSEIEISDLRIKKLGDLAAISPTETIANIYGELIKIEEIKKNEIAFVLNEPLLNIYSYSADIDEAIRLLKAENSEGISKAQKLINIHNERFGALQKQSEIAVEAAVADNRAYAQEFLSRMETTNSIAESYSSTIAALESTQQARREIQSIMSATSFENYTAPSGTISNTSSANKGSLRCQYPTSKYILVPGKGWVAVKQCDDGTYVEADKYVPDTSNMTQQQVCDMNKAARLSGGAYIIDSQPDPNCQ